MEMPEQGLDRRGGTIRQSLSLHLARGQDCCGFQAGLPDGFLFSSLVTPSSAMVGNGY
jgi:hypothetical protein